MKNFKKLFKAVSVIAATALVLSLNSPVFAQAADGTVYEAEDALLEGTPNQEGASFVEAHDTASGGKNVGFFGVAGNRITWTVEHEGGEVTLDFVLASGAFSFETFGNGPMQLAGAVKFLLNGEELPFTDMTLEGNANYDNWTDVYVPCTLKSGENKIALEILPQEGWFVNSPNIDCLKICAPGLAVAGNTAAAVKGPSKVYKADEAVCDGAIAYGDTYFEEVTGPSGSKVAGYLSMGGSITWNVEGNGGKQTLVFSLCSGALDWTTFTNADMTLADNVKVYVNGTEITFTDMTLRGTGESVWGPLSLEWSELCIPVTLNEGSNEIKLSITGMNAPKVEALEVVDGTYTGKSASATQVIEKEVIVEKVVKEKVYVETPSRITKTAAQNAKDIALYTVIFLATFAVIYIIVSVIKRNTLSEEDRKAFDKVREEKKALKDAFKAEYDKLNDAEEKEVARYAYALKCKEAKRAAYEAINTMTYGEGTKRAKALNFAYNKHLPVCALGMTVISVVLGTIIGLCYTGNVMIKTQAPLKTTYTTVVSGYDWGPAVDKVIVNLPEEIRANAVTADMFKVSVEYQGFFGNEQAERVVTDAYLSDETGNRVSGKSKYVTVEMKVGPDEAGASPFHYDFVSGFNTWADPYSMTVTLNSGKSIVIGKTEYTQLSCTRQKKLICPELTEVTENKGTYNGIELYYASYAPEKLTKDKVKNALVIWLHGAGEGGTDIRINTLGNEVTNLWSEDIQKLFDGNGAYVLAPQTPTMWMNDGTGEYTTNGTSMYTEALWELIKSYVEANPDIDTNRIIIGGCSNGGYMTMNMLLKHPDFFAAAYPCCEAYDNSWITDAELSGIKNIPMWFTHSKDDTTVIPDNFTVATVERLKNMGAKEVHFSFFDSVTDTTGLYKVADGTSPYTYMGHWSWIYALNNECRDTVNGKEVTIWEWLAGQSK